MLSTIGALRTVCERREMMNEKMKILQDLVPGCNKVIWKELIINYIQLLQHQVEVVILFIMEEGSIWSKEELLVNSGVLKGFLDARLDARLALRLSRTVSILVFVLLLARDYVSDGTKSKIREDPLYSPIQEKFFLEEGIRTFSQANLSEFNCEELFQTELLPAEKRDDEPLDD